MKPTTMLYRNLLAMETEEVLRAHPIDGAVLMGGCDKTTPGLLMGAFSMSAAVHLRAGRTHAQRPLARQDPRQRQRQLEVLGRAARRQHHRGAVAGHGGVDRPLARPLHDHGHRLDDDQRRRGAGDDAARRRLDPGGRIPTTRGWRPTPAAASSRWSGRTMRPQSFLDLRSFENAVSVVMALGGSTNAVIHLIAMARRLRHPARPRRPSTASRADAGDRQPPPLGQVPDGGLLLRRRAAGADAEHDRPAARRLPHRQRPAARREPRGRRRLRQRTSSARSTTRCRAKAACWCCTARSRRNGAVIKHTAADAGAAAAPRPGGHLRRPRRPRQAHRRPRPRRRRRTTSSCSRARARSARRACRNGARCRSRRSCCSKGVRDMLRISDARMSGTSFGACVLHVSPEAARGGPLGLVEDGDMIEIDVAARRLDLLVPAEELARRRAAWREPPPYYSRGYGALFARARHVRRRGLRLRLPDPGGRDAGAEDLLRRASGHDVRSRQRSDRTAQALLDGDPLHRPQQARAQPRLPLRRRCRCPARGRGSPGAPSPCARSPCARTSSPPTRRSTRG